MNQYFRTRYQTWYQGPEARGGAIDKKFTWWTSPTQRKKLGLQLSELEMWPPRCTFFSLTWYSCLIELILSATNFCWLWCTSPISLPMTNACCFSLSTIQRENQVEWNYNIKNMQCITSKINVIFLLCRAFCWYMVSVDKNLSKNTIGCSQTVMHMLEIIQYKCHNIIDCRHHDHPLNIDIEGYMYYKSLVLTMPCSSTGCMLDHVV
jgi:hypothetical protein